MPHRPPLATKRGNAATCAKHTSLVAKWNSSQTRSEVTKTTDLHRNKQRTCLNNGRAQKGRNSRQNSSDPPPPSPLSRPRETDTTPSRKKMETDRPESAPQNRTTGNDDAKRLHDPGSQSGGQPSLYPPSVMPSMREVLGRPTRQFLDDFARPRVCVG